MKAIILLSGGIDSTVCLAEARAMLRECECLIFNYGQANWIGEINAAGKVARHYGVEIDTVQIDRFFWRGASYLTGGGDDPLASYVPARNLLFLAHGIACAESRGADEVWFGANKDDAGFYPDCRQAFVDCMNGIGTLGTKRPVRIVAPHVERTKIGVIRLGRHLDAPLDFTTSCASEAAPCGKCRGCTAAEEAYRVLEITP
jgi:7-cyano-7-deazaguanine synthase